MSTSMTSAERTKLLAYLDEKARVSKNIVEKFKSRLEENPEYAFEWGQGALDASAALNIYRPLRDYIAREDSTLEEVRKHLEESIRKSARLCNHYSTAPMENMLRQSRASVYADLSDTIFGLMAAIR